MLGLFGAARSCSLLYRISTPRTFQSSYACPRRFYASSTSPPTPPTPPSTPQKPPPTAKTATVTATTTLPVNESLKSLEIVTPDTLQPPVRLEPEPRPRAPRPVPPELIPTPAAPPSPYPRAFKWLSKGVQEPVEYFIPFESTGGKIFYYGIAVMLGFFGGLFAFEFLGNQDFKTYVNVHVDRLFPVFALFPIYSSESSSTRNFTDRSDLAESKDASPQDQPPVSTPTINSPEIVAAAAEAQPHPTNSAEDHQQQAAESVPGASGVPQNPPNNSDNDERSVENLRETISAEVRRTLEQDTKVDQHLREHEEKLEAMQAHINSLLATLQQHTDSSAKEQEQQFKAYREMLSLQEASWEQKVKQVAQMAYDAAEKNVQHYKKGLEQQFSEQLEEEIEREKAAMTESLERSKEDLKRQYEDELVRASAANLATVLADLEAVQEHYQGKHSSRIDDLNKIHQHVAEMEEVVNTHQAELERERQLHQLSVALLRFCSALGSPKMVPFEEQLQELKSVVRGDLLVEQALKTLPADIATTGVSTCAQLMERFKAVAATARQAALVPEQGGLVGNMMAAVASRFIIPEKGLVEGSSPQAILAKAEYYAEQGDLSAAVQQVQLLQGMPAAVCKDWVQAARARISADQLVNLLHAHVATLLAS